MCRPARLSILALLAFTLIALIASGVAGAFQQSATSPAPLTKDYFNNLDKSREQLQRATDILKKLSLSDGDWAADVGAGNGYYSQRMASLVGASGRVFAEDIGAYAINVLHERVRLFDLRNVDVVKGDVGDPNLPADSLTAVLVVDSYHHFSQHQAMTQQIRKALKPGGRLVVADYSRTDHRDLPRADQLKIHEIDPELVRAELEQCGFRFLECEDPFVKRVPEAKDSSANRADLWLMVAVRPN